MLDGRKPDKKQISSIVEKLGLSERLNHLPNQLSGGQQQRVAIARACSNNRALVIADAPRGYLVSALSADRIISIEDGKIVRDEVRMG